MVVCLLYLKERKGHNGTQKWRGTRRPKAIYADGKASEKHQRPAKGQPWRHPTVNQTEQRKEVN